MKPALAGFLIFVFLLPVVSAHDDEILIKNALFNWNDDDQTLAAASHASKADDSRTLCILLEQLGYAKLTTNCFFLIDASFDILTSFTTVTFGGQYVGMPDGRGPPASPATI